MMRFIALLALTVVVTAAWQQYGVRLFTVARSVVCRHATLTLAACGRAAFSVDADTVVTIEISCSGCGECWHSTVDVTQALREGLAVKR